MIKKFDKQPQLGMFATLFASFLNPEHKFCLLAKKINWNRPKKESSPLTDQLAGLRFQPGPSLHERDKESPLPIEVCKNTKEPQTLMQSQTKLQSIAIKIYNELVSKMNPIHHKDFEKLDVLFRVLT